MQYGVVFPQNEIGSDLAVIRDYVQTAEGLGFDYLIAYDHVLGANPDRPGGWDGPYAYDDMFHEVFVLFGYLAAITERIQLTTSILIAPQRQTVLLAKQAAQIAVLSENRLRLGVGIGWNKIEYDALGYDFEKRGERADEQAALLKRLWSEKLVTYEGEYETIDDAGINPRPNQPIPLWFGGRADAVLRRMARYGDGWMPGGMAVADAAEKMETIRAYLAVEGRDPYDFGLDAWLMAGDTPETDWDSYMGAWAEAGATHICFNTLRAGYESPQQHIDMMKRFANHISLPTT